MDLKEYFREVDGEPEHVQRKVAARRDATGSGGCCAPTPKPTIAMVNGWCFGGAFTPARRLRPRHRRRRGDVRALGDQLGHPARQRRQQGARRHRRLARRRCLRHDRRALRRPRAAEMGLVNASVPLAELRDEVEALARELLAKNPVVLRAAKLGFKHCRHDELGSGRGLPLREARAVAVPRHRARPRAGP